MSKMHYFRDKFSKIAKRWGLSAPSAASPSLLMTWSSVIWPKIVVYEANYDEVELQKYSFNVISVTSPKNVTEKRHQNDVIKLFSNLGLFNQNFWLRQCPSPIQIATQRKSIQQGFELVLFYIYIIHLNRIICRRSDKFLI